MTAPDLTPVQHSGQWWFPAAGDPLLPDGTPVQWLHHDVVQALVDGYAAIGTDPELVPAVAAGGALTSALAAAVHVPGTEPAMWTTPPIGTSKTGDTVTLMAFPHPLGWVVAPFVDEPAPSAS